MEIKAAVKEITAFFVKRRRFMNDAELDSIVGKYTASDDEVKTMVRYLGSDAGKAAIMKELQERETDLSADQPAKYEPRHDIEFEQKLVSELQHPFGGLLNPGRYPKRDESVIKLGATTIAHVHDNGDLTVRTKDGKLWVVTTEGKVSEEKKGKESKVESSSKEESLPESIARQLGVNYNGRQMDGDTFLGYMFTDRKTGSSFVCFDLEDCRQKLAKMRAEFEKMDKSYLIEDDRMLPFADYAAGTGKWVGIFKDQKITVTITGMIATRRNLEQSRVKLQNPKSAEDIVFSGAGGESAWWQQWSQNQNFVVQVTGILGISSMHGTSREAIMEIMESMFANSVAAIKVEQPSYLKESKPWEMTKPERDTEISRLKTEFHNVLATPSPLEGNISPYQIGRFSERGQKRYSEDLLKKIQIEERIALLSKSDAELADVVKRMANKERDSRITQLKRHISDIEGLGTMSHLPNGKLKAPYQRDMDLTKAELDKLERSYLREPVISDEACQVMPPEYYWLLPILGTVPNASFLVEPEAKGRKIDEILKRLKEGVESISGSAVFRDYLVTMSKFYNYSIGNQILIMIQRKNATRVAGFTTWKDLGRNVKYGEKGIAILAPCTPAKPKPKEGEEEEEAETAPRPTYFKVVYVFDVSQTEGKPLPEVEVKALTGAANEELFAKVMAMLKKQDVAVSFESRPDQDPGIKGYFMGKSIWVRPEESRAQQLKTLIHETGHYYTESVFGIARSDAETIAESVAFTVGAHFGYDSGTYSFSYVAIWSKEKKVLERNLNSISRISSRLINELEKAKN